VLNYTTTSGGSPVTTSDIGNIIYKSDVGNYVYPSAGQPQPHGVQSIASPSTGTTLYTISYDSVGKVLTDGLSGNTITYTPFQMPLKVTPASGSAYTVQYDADHNRIMRTVGTSLVIYLPDSDLTMAPASAKTTWNTYFMAAGQRVAQDYVTQSGSSTTILTEYFESDYQNSIGMVTDDKFTGANAKVDQGFDAFGRPRSAAGVNASPWPGTAPPRGYINQVMLTGEQIIDLNARYYDPALARFLEPDPIISDMEDSQAWNAYSYSHNNPMSKEDPTGMTPTAADVAASAQMNADTDPAAIHAGGAEVSINGHDSGHVSNSVAVQLQSGLSASSGSGGGSAHGHEDGGVGIPPVAAVHQESLSSHESAASSTSQGTNTTIVHGDGTTEIRSGSAAFRDNNPGNVTAGRFAEGHGEIGIDPASKYHPSLAVFENTAIGRSALSAMIATPEVGKRDISSEMSRYASSKTDRPGEYAHTIASKLGLPVTTLISRLTPEQREIVVQAIAQTEGSYGTSRFLRP
jgi:RHS repeat-associated protein